MNDFSVIQTRITAPITSVDIVDAQGEVVSIRGKQFSNVRKVIFGGSEISDFVVLSTSEIRFKMPPPPIDLEAPIQVITESSSAVSPTATSNLIALQANLKKPASGFDKVLQKFLKILLTKKGSNFFNLQEGTSLMFLVGSNSPNISTVNSSVRDAFDQVSSTQSDEALLPSEIITSASVVNSYFDPRRASINIELEIETADGLARFTEVNV